MIAELTGMEYWTRRAQLCATVEKLGSSAGLPDLSTCNAISSRAKSREKFQSSMSPGMHHQAPNATIVSDGSISQARATAARSRAASWKDRRSADF
jgi:hypothetical protein